MKREKFIKHCNELNVSYKIEGIPQSYGVVSLDAPKGFLLGDNDILIFI